jgi:hypothetical protein
MPNDLFLGIPRATTFIESPIATPSLSEVPLSD